MEARDQLEFCRETIAESLAASRGKVHTLTTFGRGQTDHVRIFTASHGGEIREITFFVAQILGRKVKPRAGIGYGGGGYSKGLDAAMDTYRAVGRELDQGNWREL